jgi:RNA polymerase sigma-70 factor (TIGR02943 family)
MTFRKEHLTEWVKSFSQDLYKWAVHKVSDVEVAKDLVQETFLAASLKIETFKGDSTPKTWLFSILNFKIIDHYRKKVRQPLSLDQSNFGNFFDEHGSWKQEKRPKDWHDNEKHLLDDDDFQTILKMCLDALPEKWNLCVKLKYLMNKGGDEICEELDITPTNFWQIIHRAKLNLRECVENNWLKD